MSNRKKELIRELKKIRNDRDFVVGAVSIAGSEIVYARLLEYIGVARRSDLTVSSDDVLAMAYSLRKEMDGKKTDRRIVAAML